MNNDNTLEDSVRGLIKKELPEMVTFLFKKIEITDDEPLQNSFELEDIVYMALVYFEHFKINSEKFSMDNYFPWKTSCFSKKHVIQAKKPLTIDMFISSAKAGWWLYE